MTRRSLRCFILLALMLPFSPELHSQIRRDSLSIRFRQSKIDIDTAFHDNGNQLRAFRKRLDIISSPDSAYTLTSIDIVGGASPEGSVKFNDWLSLQRAKRIYNAVKSPMQPEDSVVNFRTLGRDWKGLRNLVDADPNVPYREDVLFLLDDIIADCRNGETEKTRNLARIRMLKGGAPYRYLYKKHFPALRTSKLFFNFRRLQPVAAEVIHTDAFIPAVPEIRVDTVEKYVLYCPPCKPFYMDLGTNLLLDALAIPNISAEFYLGKDFSIRADWMYAWWDTDRRHRYWRVYGGDIDLRWWFGKKALEKPLTGHHLGVYGQFLTYDFEWGGKGRMGGEPGDNLWQRGNWGAGVTYGYSLPVTRRLNIDFEIGLGYFGGKYYEYQPEGGCYEWIATKKLNYFGPTRLGVSLVWLIGCDNYNRPKSNLSNSKGNTVRKEVAYGID